MNRPRPRSRVLAFALMFGCLAASAAAQELPDGVTVDGPPPPVAPATITRDERNRVTVRAIRLTERMTLDGRLDEAVYKEVPPITGFFQMEPVEIGRAHV